MWTCSKCGSVVDSTFEVCWNCGTSQTGVEDPSFITADNAGPISDPVADHAAILGGVPGASDQFANDPAGALAVCYQANDLMEAKFLADQLLGEGIFAITDNQELQVELGPMDGNPRVYCRAGDLHRARAWLEAYEQRKP